MRPLKFRAWDGKKMQYDVFPTSNNTVGRWVETDGGIELHFCDSGGTKVDIMQFTGLNDKNGKELGWWEGDIFARASDRRIEGTIVFDMGCFWLERKRDGRTPLYECVDWSMYKVGDIHQNSDLLK